jgi:hypothetical protein
MDIEIKGKILLPLYPPVVEVILLLGYVNRSP